MEEVVHNYAQWVTTNTRGVNAPLSLHFRARIPTFHIRSHHMTTWKCERGGGFRAGLAHLGRSVGGMVPPLTAWTLEVPHFARFEFLDPFHEASAPPNNVHRQSVMSTVSRLVRTASLCRPVLVRSREPTYG